MSATKHGKADRGSAAPAEDADPASASAAPTEPRAKSKTDDGNASAASGDAPLKANQGDAMPVADLQSIIEKEFIDQPPGDRQTDADPDQEEKPVPRPAASRGKSRWAGRGVRSLLALLLVIAVGWYPVQRLFQVSSTEAVVNAPLVTLRAPIGGQIHQRLPSMRLGEQVTADTPLFGIRNNRVDDGRLTTLRSELEEQRALLLPPRVHQRRLEKLRDDLTGQVMRFQEGRIRQLDARQRMLEADLNGALAILKEAREDYERQTNLGEREVAPRIKIAEAEREFAVAKAKVDSIRANMAGLAVERAAISRGVFLGDSYNDRPQSAQKIDGVEEQIARLEAEIARGELVVERLEKTMQAEKDRIAKLRAAEVAAPLQAQIWEVLTSPGEEVVLGQELIRLLDCSRAVVTATVSENVYNSLALGTRVKFHLREGAKAMPGRVVQLAGYSAASSNFAILPSLLIKESYRVAISVGELATMGSCPVGQTGRVVFPKETAAASVF